MKSASISGPGTSIRDQVFQVVMTLFLLPFAAGGVFLLAQGLNALAEGRWGEGGGMLLGGLLFGGVSAGGIFFLFWRPRSQRREQERKAAAPDAPWMWREDWAAGKVKSSGGMEQGFFWGFAIVWNLVSLPLVYFLPEEIVEKGNTAALLGFLFPMVGIGLLVFAVRLSMARARYGESWFSLNNVPGVVGGSIAGIIHVEKPLPPGTPVDLILSSIRRGVGKNSSDTTLWQDEHQAVEAGGISVHFRIPYECQPTSGGEGPSIFWRLTAGSSVPGVDYRASFEVPVFRTARSSPSITEESILQDDAQRVSAGPTPPHQEVEPAAWVEVRPKSPEGKEFLLRPGGIPKGSAGLFVFLAVWMGIVALLAISDAPIMFPLVFGMFGVVIVALVAITAMLETRIVIEGGTVEVMHRILGFRHGVRFPCSEVTAVHTAAGGQSGTKSSYSVEFVQRSGTKIGTWHFVPDRSQAEWLARELSRALEPWRERSPSTHQ